MRSTDTIQMEYFRCHSLIIDDDDATLFADTFLGVGVELIHSVYGRGHPMPTILLSYATLSESKSY